MEYGIAGSHLLAGEPKTGIIRKLETQWGMLTTHILETRAPAWSDQSI